MALENQPCSLFSLWRRRRKGGGECIYRGDPAWDIMSKAPQFDVIQEKACSCVFQPKESWKNHQSETNHPAELLTCSLWDNSGGQQKRVALASVLILNNFIILDEPQVVWDGEWLEGYLSRGNKTLFEVTRPLLPRPKYAMSFLIDNHYYTYRDVAIIWKGGKNAWWLRLNCTQTIFIEKNWIGWTHATNARPQARYRERMPSSAIE